MTNLKICPRFLQWTILVSSQQKYKYKKYKYKYQNKNTITK